MDGVIQPKCAMFALFAIRLLILLDKIASLCIVNLWLWTVCELLDRTINPLKVLKVLIASMNSIISNYWGKVSLKNIFFFESVGLGFNLFIRISKKNACKSCISICFLQENQRGCENKEAKPEKHCVSS